MWGSDIGNTPSEALDRKNISMCCAENEGKQYVSKYSTAERLAVTHMARWKNASGLFPSSTADPTQGRR